jgi:hypothetical protein
MSGYGDIVARISALDARLAEIDPNWQSNGALVGTASGAIDSGSPFAGVLAEVSSSASDGASTSATSSASASADRVAIASNAYANTIYSGIRVLGGIGFGSPLPGGKLTQAFGPTTLAMEPPATVDGVTYAHYHPGIDLAAQFGAPILAAANGTVIEAGPVSDGAVVVKVRHDDGYVTAYGHLNPDLEVKVGDTVSRGQEIGTEGVTGNTTGPHLHFALYTPGGTAVDPTPYLDTGLLPNSISPTGPASTSDPGATASDASPTALARFDAVASEIPYAAQIRTAAVANGIDPLLLASLVSTESSFHPNAVSGVGAQGLTQLMPRTASDIGVQDAFDPQQNLDGGAKYLALQLQRFGRVDMALAAYNQGPGAVSRADAVPDSARAYVSHVLGKWANYKESAS